MKVRYNGLGGQVNRRIGAETGEGDLLVEGKVYDLSDELGISLVLSDANFEPNGKAAEKLVDDAKAARELAEEQPEGSGLKEGPPAPEEAES